MTSENTTRKQFRNRDIPRECYTNELAALLAIVQF